MRGYRVPAGQNVERLITLPIEEAFFDALDAATAATAMGCTRQAIYYLIGAGRQAVAAGDSAAIADGKLRCVTDVEIAERIEKATREHGKHVVPAAELIGWAPWRGPERHETGQQQHGRKAGPSRRRTPPPSGFYPTPAPADAQLAA